MKTPLLQDYIDELNKGGDMKTVIDAVNFYRGDYWYCGSTKNIATEQICTREEFNQCVEELSTNFGRSSMKHLGLWLNEKPFEDADFIPIQFDVHFTPETNVYTQAMSDNGELPSVGMNCMIKDEPYNEIYYEGVIVFNGINWIVWTHGGTEYSQSKEHLKFKPIDTRTDKEKAIDDLADRPLCSDDDHGLLDAIIAGKIHGVKWVGK